MGDDAVVLLKMAAMRHRLERIRAGMSVGAAAFPGDEGAVERVAFNVLLAVQEAVDLGAHLIAREGWDPPDGLGATFTVLQERGVLEHATAEAMRRGTRLRNLIAHGYAKLDPARLFASAAAGVREFEGFLAEVARWERQRSPQHP